MRITEIFYSIQGESSYAGLPCVFVRLTWCNLRCTWCDSEYTFQGGTEMTVAEVMEKVRSYNCKLVEVTGGEPLVQKRPCCELVTQLCDEGYTVLIETGGSVVGSWLLDLTAMALAENPSLSNYSGFVQDSGEGRWTIQTAIEEAVPVDVLATSLFARFRSRQDQTFADKVLSAMRNKFGGHIERPTGG